MSPSVLEVLSERFCLCVYFSVVFVCFSQNHSLNPFIFFSVYSLWFVSFQHSACSFLNICWFVGGNIVIGGLVLVLGGWLFLLFLLLSWWFLWMLMFFCFIVLVETHPSCCCVLFYALAFVAPFPQIWLQKLGGRVWANQVKTNRKEPSLSFKRSRVWLAIRNLGFKSWRLQTPVSTH